MSTVLKPESLTGDDHLRALGAGVDCKLEIKPRHDMTIGQLIELVREGRDVVYSPHLGNRSRGDMAVTRLGVRTILVNRNAAAIDTWDHPNLIRAGGADLRFSSAAQDRVLTPFLEPDGADAPAILDKFGRFGRTPAQVHAVSVEAAMPGDYRINDSYMFGEDPRGQRIADILRHVARDPLAHVFDRAIVDRRIQPVSREALPTDGAERFLDAVPHMVRNIREGRTDAVETPVPSNDLMVIAMAIRDALGQIESSPDVPDELDVYTVSGPDMINYMHGRHLPMSYLYSRAREVEPRLPRHLRYHVVPGSTLEFLPVSNEPDACAMVDRLVASEVRKVEIDLLLKRKDFTGDKGALVREKKALMGTQDVDRTAFAAWRAVRAPYFHYDALLDGVQLHDPAGLDQLSFKAVDNLFAARPA